MRSILITLSWPLMLACASLLPVAYNSAPPAHATESTQPDGAMTTQLYDVKDLVHPREAAGADDDADRFPVADLMQNLEDATSPEFWDREGARPSTDDEQHEVLKVVATADMHRKVEGVLHDIRVHRRSR